MTVVGGGSMLGPKIEPNLESLGKIKRGTVLLLKLDQAMMHALEVNGRGNALLGGISLAIKDKCGHDDFLVLLFSPDTDMRALTDKKMRKYVKRAIRQATKENLWTKW